MPTPPAGGVFTLPGTSLKLNRLGFGAMRLTGPRIWGPPADPAAAIAVLREAVDLGVNHIDTSDFYGPHVANQLIRQALHPYPQGLTIVTKVGFRRADDSSWLPAHSPEELRSAVTDNLRNLGLDVLDVVNLRLAKDPATETASVLEERLSVLAGLQRQGLIRHIGISNVTPAQFAQAHAFTKLVCVQNEYNIAQRADDIFLDALAQQGVAYVPYFPLGGFSPLQSAALSTVADNLSATPMQVALAWLLQRSPNILLIPGTSSITHLRENMQASALTLDAAALATLDSLALEQKH